MNSLRRLLDERGLTQRQLARMTGITREMIGHVSNGKTKFRYPVHIAALSFATDLEPDEFEDIYDGIQPLPEREAPRPARSLPGEPLGQLIRNRLADVPFGEKGKFLATSELPPPYSLEIGKLRVKNVERICERLGVHPFDVYGVRYSEVAS